jgi:hypothetical protein
MVVTAAHQVENMSVTEAFAVVLVLATRRDPRRGRAARRLADRAALEQAAAQRLHDELAPVLDRLNKGDATAADHAAAILERAGFRGAEREVRERREADGRSSSG